MYPVHFEKHSGQLIIGIKLRLDLIQVQSLLRYSCNIVLYALTGEASHYYNTFLLTGL